jgi:ABC-type transporter Mla subunit MlaD
MFGFTSVSHFFARMGKDIVQVAKLAGPLAAKVDRTLEANKPLIEGLSALISPAAPAIEDAAFALLGHVAGALQSTSAAVDQKGLNLQLDQETIAAIKALLPEIEAFAHARGMVKPAI